MNTKTFKPTSKKMTLAELENYVNSKENCRFCYSYENNPNNIYDSLSLVVCFDKMVFGHYTNTIGLCYNRTENYNIFKNELHIYGVTSIQLTDMGIGESITITAKNYDMIERKYLIIFDHD